MPGLDYTVSNLLHGVIKHGTYHGGQIALLKRAISCPPTRWPMPIDYRIDSARGVVFTTATGTLTNREVLEQRQRLFQDPAFPGDLVELADARGVHQLDVTPDGIGQFVDHDSKHASLLARYKIAIVATEDVVFGMARMYQT